MSDIIIRQPDPEEHIKKGSALIQQAQEAVIASNEDRELAGMVIAELSNIIDRIKKEFDGTEDEPGPVKLMHMAWKKGVALRDKALAGAEGAKEIWNSKIKRFEFEVEQKRQAEVRRLQIAAQKKAEEERERQIREAKRLGDKEAVENLQEAPIIAQPVAPKTPEITKAAGILRSAPEWRWEVSNYEAIPCRFHILDEKGISALVKRLGPKAGIPGITIYDARSRGME